MRTSAAAAGVHIRAILGHHLQRDLSPADRLPAPGPQRGRAWAPSVRRPLSSSASILFCRT
eukprot:1266925-Pyramimonas_sp.AAC.1